MPENGGIDTEKKPSLTGEIFSLLDDQIELTSLELEYESAQGMKRLAALAAAFILALTSFVVLQVAIVAGLMALGLPLWAASVLLAVVYGGVGFGLAWKCGRRDPAAGAPFQGTRDEIRKNLKWIRQLL